jgi:hypothetical protein
VFGLKRTSNLTLSSHAGTRVVAAPDDVYKVPLESIHDEVIVIFWCLFLIQFVIDLGEMPHLPWNN